MVQGATLAARLGWRAKARLGCAVKRCWRLGRAALMPAVSRGGSGPSEYTKNGALGLGLRRGLAREREEVTANAAKGSRRCSGDRKEASGGEGGGSGEQSPSTQSGRKRERGAGASSPPHLTPAMNGR
jgi:hypothetical protein